MATREINQRQHLIIRYLKRNPASFKEITAYLEQESEIRGEDLVPSIRTFNRDRDDIYSTYGIHIEYDHSMKVYKINDELPLEVEERIMEAFDMIDTFKVSQDLSKHVLFEQRRAIGSEHMFGLLHAIKQCFQVRFQYQKYYEPSPTSREVQPLALKEFKGRWYVLAVDTKDGVKKTFALDRLSVLDITKVKFKSPRDFEPHVFFRYSYGIVTGNQQEPDDVILSFTPFQGKYIKSMPLHQSQEVLRDNDQELRVRLKVHVSHDFVFELLSLGNQVKVIAPQSLMEELKEHYRSALNQYK